MNLCSLRYHRSLPCVTKSINQISLRGCCTCSVRFHPSVSRIFNQRNNITIPVQTGLAPVRSASSFITNIAGFASAILRPNSIIIYHKEMNYNARAYANQDENIEEISVYIMFNTNILSR